MITARRAAIGTDYSNDQYGNHRSLDLRAAAGELGVAGDIGNDRLRGGVAWGCRSVRESALPT
jgi:hypothetical protein